MRLKNTAMALLSAAVIGGFMFAPQAAQAQWWERDRDRDRGRQDWNRDRNDRSRDRGDWDRGRVDRRHVERLINELERSSNTFRNAVERHRFDDRSIHSRYGRDERYRRDDSRGHDELKRMVQRMDESIEHLRRDFDRNEHRGDIRSQLTQVMRSARVVDRMIDDRRYPNSIEILWRRVSSDLNALASIHNMGRF